MPIELGLPSQLKKAGWKVKIRENETREHPHISILRRTQTWRLNLRTGEFMDRRPDPSRVPNKLLGFIRGNQTWQWLCEQWDLKYPNNPVVSHEEEDSGDEHSSTNAT